MNQITGYLLVGAFLSMIYLMVFFEAYEDKRYPKVKRRKKVFFIMALLVLFGWPLIALQAWVKECWDHVKNVK